MMFSSGIVRVMVVMCMLAAVSSGVAQMIVVKPVQSDRVLNTPGIGFTPFQRFNGDSLNSGTAWTEGMPSDARRIPGATVAPGYPDTTVAYLRLYWRFLQPERGRYDWSLIDNALETAQRHGQTLMLRIAPHGPLPAADVPAWYRKETGEQLASDRAKTNCQSKQTKWMVDPERPEYAREFGGMVRALAKRYDCGPRLELVDISILAAWGEGAGSELLTDATRKTLVSS